MKRRVSSSDFSNRELKRANSSLFSIATIVEDQGASSSSSSSSTISLPDVAGALASDENPPPIVPSSLLSPNKERQQNIGNKGGAVGTVSSATNSPSPTTTTTTTTPCVSSVEDTEVSSSSDEGFYIEEDDTDEEFAPPTSCAPPTTSKTLTTTTTTTTPMSTTTTTLTNTIPKPISTDFYKTGLIFESSSQHYDRYNKYHKERPLRVEAIQNYILGGDDAANLKSRCVVVCNENEAAAGMEWEFLEDDDYLRVHLPGYMKRLDRISNCTCNDRLDREAEQYKSIYFTPHSLISAKKAASSLCSLVSSVVSSKLNNGFAVIRPPGHHAEPGLAGGYCVINNIAVAAAYAREKLGIQKILIVDWDVHHGNGTQSIFLNDPDVLYFSVHRYHHGNFFPFLNSSGPTTVGNGRGRGYNINVGWNSKGMGDEEYMAVWERILMPVANEFEPELVLVSAGFDAAAEDMGECNVTADGFAAMTRHLMTLAEGRVVCALEGGYVRRVLCNCVESVVKTLLDRNSVARALEEMKSFQGVERKINSSAAKSIHETTMAHQEYWACLQDVL